MGIYIWVSIGSGNSWLPDNTKPLPEPMLTYHQYGSVALTQDQFHKSAQDINSENEFKESNCKITSTSVRGHWVVK